MDARKAKNTTTKQESSSTSATTNGEGIIIPIGVTSIPQTPAKGHSEVDVIAQYQGIYTPAGYFAFTPMPCYKFIKCYVTVINLNGPSRDIGNPFYFKLYDSLNEGHRYEIIFGGGND